MNYRVTVHGQYDLVKRDVSIRSARAWAARAFPGQTVTVDVDGKYRFCDDCQSAPCGCRLTTRDVR